MDVEELWDYEDGLNGGVLHLASRHDLAFVVIHKLCQALPSVGGRIAICKVLALYNGTSS